MALITHMNICNADQEIYCCLRNKIVKLDIQQQEQFCSSCKMLAVYTDGRAGHGVTCIWEDLRDVSNPHYALDPLEEFIHNQIRQVPPEGTALFSFSS